MKSEEEKNDQASFVQYIDLVVGSGRWRKWLAPDEVERDLDQLTPARQEWLIATGARYVWTNPQVLAARQQLYDNLSPELSAPNDFIVDRIAQSVQKYVTVFNLKDSFPLLVK